MEQTISEKLYLIPKEGLNEAGFGNNPTGLMLALSKDESVGKIKTYSVGAWTVLEGKGWKITHSSMRYGYLKLPEHTSYGNNLTACTYCAEISPYANKREINNIIRKYFVVLEGEPIDDINYF
jgi:hypothetical protein